MRASTEAESLNSYDSTRQMWRSNETMKEMITDLKANLECHKKMLTDLMTVEQQGLFESLHAWVQHLTDQLAVEREEKADLRLWLDEFE